MTGNSYLILIFVLQAVCLSGIVGSGATGGCQASAFSYGPECSATVSGDPKAKITYSVQFGSTGIKTKLCCKAYSCLRNRCSLQNVGCSSAGWLVTAKLDWGNNVAAPKMQCKGDPYGTRYDFYYYTTSS